MNKEQKQLAIIAVLQHTLLIVLTFVVSAYRGHPQVLSALSLMYLWISVPALVLTAKLALTRRKVLFSDDRMLLSFALVVINSPLTQFPYYLVYSYLNVDLPVK